MERTVLYQDPYLYCGHTVDPSPVPEADDARVSLFATIFFNIAGGKHFVIEGNTYEVQPGEVLIVAQSDAYSMRSDPSSPSEYYEFTFSRYIYRRLDPEFSFMQVFDRAKNGGGNLLRPDERQAQLFEACARHAELTDGALKRRAAIIACLLMFILELNGSSLLPAAHTADDEGRRILSYVGDHLTEELTVKELARRFYMSGSQFYRKFKKLTDMTLLSYVTSKRVLLARDMILLNVKVKEAMCRCGFKDYTTFYKCSYKYLNVPPSFFHPTKDRDMLLTKGFFRIEEEKDEE